MDTEPAPIYIDLDFQLAEDLAENIHCPSLSEMQSWIRLAMESDAQQENKNLPESIELTIRIVAADEIRQLNKSYRHIDKATNILSFPAEVPEYIPINLLGDLIICHSIIEHEAIQQHKDLTAHWAHIIMHGVLHLLAYDHIKEGEAEIMEALEIKMMQELGFNNPYSN
ncbi:MAG: rRNA maturation RNase YbeY [Pseudomonadota bacterium]